MTAIAPALQPLAKPKIQSAAMKTWLRYRRNKMAMVALGFIIGSILMAIFAPWISPYPPYYQDYSATWSLPTAQHLLGTDDVGRDLLTRLIWGSRISIAIGLLSQFSVVVIGIPLGAVAGLRGGWVDFIVMRVVYIMLSVPTILLYILLVIALGQGFWNLLLAMAIINWVGMARLVRGQVLSLKETDYVRAARAMGGNTRHIVFTHLIRNSMTPILVTVALGVPGAMFAEAGLSFLGLGVPPPYASWGRQIGAYQAYIYSFWHLTVFPSILLAITMLSWLTAGDGLRDALDPSMRV